MRPDQFLRTYLSKKREREQGETVTGDLLRIRDQTVVAESAVPVIPVDDIWDEVQDIQEQLAGRFYSNPRRIREDLATLETYGMTHGYRDETDDELYVGVSGLGQLSAALQYDEEYAPLHDAIESVIGPVDAA